MYEGSVNESRADVLVVDDEPMLADLIGEWVQEKWNCQTVYNGRDAIETISAEIDVVLLDRQMPDLTGDEVLTTIREEGVPCQVMMVSAAQPDFDIFDLPFDDYLRKPVDRPEVQEKVEQLLLRRTYHPDIQQFFTITAKLALLESLKLPQELEANEEYLALKATADDIRQDADATLGVRTNHVEEIVDINADD